MHIEPLSKDTKLGIGLALLVSDGFTVQTGYIEQLIDTAGGIEVVFDTEENKYFNVQMYLSGQSWARDVRVVRRSKLSVHEQLESLLPALSGTKRMKKGKTLEMTDVAHVTISDAMLDELVQIHGATPRWDDWYRCVVAYVDGVQYRLKPAKDPSSAYDLSQHIAWRLTENTVEMFKEQKSVGSK